MKNFQAGGYQARACLEGIQYTNHLLPFSRVTQLSRIAAWLWSLSKKPRRKKQKSYSLENILYWYNGTRYTLTLLKILCAGECLLFFLSFEEMIPLRGSNLLMHNWLGNYSFELILESTSFKEININDISVLSCFFSAFITFNVLRFQYHTCSPWGLANVIFPEASYHTWNYCKLQMVYGSLK